MKTPGVKITFNEEIDLYVAEEKRGQGLCGAFGKTPEEAMARLEFAKSVWADCELCSPHCGSAPPKGP